MKILPVANHQTKNKNNLSISNQTSFGSAKLIKILERPLFDIVIKADRTPNKLVKMVPSNENVALASSVNVFIEKVFDDDPPFDKIVMASDKIQELTKMVKILKEKMLETLNLKRAKELLREFFDEKDTKKYIESWRNWPSHISRSMEKLDEVGKTIDTGKVTWSKKDKTLSFVLDYSPET